MESMEFNIARPEEARWLAIMLSELQSYAVRFTITKNANLVYVEIK
jgi:hypothetical protein